MKRSSRFFCGVDFGGTAAKIGIVDENGAIRSKKRREISAAQGYEEILAMVAQEIRRQCGRIRPAAIGIGAPGFIDRHEGKVLQGSENLRAFRGRSLVRYLGEEFGLPVFADNDANCAAAGELKFGSGARYTSFVMVTLGAGVGGALVLDGKVFRGSRGLAGEIGHICLDAQGPPCTCGSRGCFEQYAAAPAIVRRYQEIRRQQGRQPGDPARSDPARGDPARGDPARRDLPDAQSVFRQAARGEPAALQVVEESARHIARVLGNLVNLLNPEACIIGGGVSAAGEDLLIPVRKHIAAFAWPLPLAGVEIHIASLRNDAGILGAAAQCLERLEA